MTLPHQPDEALAKQRYMLMNALRIGSIAAVILGIATARGVVDLPYPLGVALAVVGLIAFFFGPRALAKKWKSQGTDENR